MVSRDRGADRGKHHEMGMEKYEKYGKRDERRGMREKEKEDEMRSEMK